MGELLIRVKAFHTVFKAVDTVLHSDKLAVPSLLPYPPKFFPYLDDGFDAVLDTCLFVKNVIQVI